MHGDVGAHIHGNILTLGTQGHMVMAACVHRALTPERGAAQDVSWSPGYSIAVVTKAHSA